MKKFLAIFFAKMAMFFSRTLRRGGGTALPGLIAQKIDKDILSKLVGNLKDGVVIITGTNGKTTTAKMACDILANSGLDIVSNQSGSNLSRGLISVLISRSNLTGSTTKGDLAVFEIDEATMPEAVPMLSPRYIIVTNIFRDQLDRYGEVDKTVELIGNSLRTAPKEATVILNADDPMVASLTSFHENTIFFGLEDSGLKTESKLAIDNKDCLLCGAELDFEYRYFGHLGKYKCSSCTFKRPKPENTVYKAELNPENSVISLHTSKKENIDLTLSIPGVYNIYNALAATALSSALDANSEQIKYGLENFTAAWGRMEKIQVKDKYIFLLLVKNPTGFNESLRSFINTKEKKNFLLALNDNFADGIDISWIWDSELELLKDKESSIVCSGIRAEDIALRLKYAELDSKNITIEKDLKKALDMGLDSVPTGETLYIFPTYTAMMEIRNVLVKAGYAQSFWQPPGA